MIEKICDKLCNFVKKNSKNEVSNNDLEILHYITHVIILNTYKAAIIFSIAYFFHILWPVILGVGIFGCTRVFAGGVHLPDTIICLIVSLLIILGPVLIGIYIPYNFFIISIIFVINLILVIKYAPADTEYKPLYSKKIRRKLKFRSIIFVIITYCFSLFLTSMYSNIIIFIVFIGCLTILPITYKIFKRRYRNYV